MQSGFLSYTLINLDLRVFKCIIIPSHKNADFFCLAKYWNLHLNNFLNAFLGILFGNHYQWCLFKSLKQFILSRWNLCKVCDFQGYISFKCIFILFYFPFLCIFFCFPHHFTNVFSFIWFKNYFSISKLKLP